MYIKSIVSAIFGVICLYVLFEYISGISTSNVSKSWSEIEAEVISSEVTVCGKGRSYYPSIEYKYSIGENSYVSDRIILGHSGCGSQRRAEKFVDTYIPGNLIVAFYDPNNPNESVLISGDILWDTWFMVLLMVVFIVASLKTSFYWCKKAKAASNRKRIL